MKTYDVAVIGGGPAGLAAAVSAFDEGASVLLIERDARLGGILKQCIHDGFGLIEFGERLSGPEYTERFVKEVMKRAIDTEVLTFVTRIAEEDGMKKITYVNEKGVTAVLAKTLVLATGCRERTARQVRIHGTRPAGIFTAGSAQNYVNLQGQMPTRRCVILGSGDIGLIMARRLTLEGAEVLGVYEVKPEPSGLTRNIVQCLEDYDIPLHLSHTVTRVFGADRLTGVEIAKVDEKMDPIPGTEEKIECDALILSVGLIPENEMAETLGVTMNRGTKGPTVWDDFMTVKDGIYSCGNALHVNDLVDYVTESGRLAGKAAAHHETRERKAVTLSADRTLLYSVPQMVEKESGRDKAVIYFRSRRVLGRSKLLIKNGDDVVYEKTFSKLKPPEMERIVLEPEVLTGAGALELTMTIEEVEK